MARIAFALVVGAGAVALAQVPQGPAFEVASVRLWAPGTPISQRITETRVDITNRTLRALLLLAFRVPPHQFDGPEWLDEVRVNIQATLPPGATRQQLPEMLQRLLAERFGLVAHRELRPLDGFELSVGTGGIKMKEVQPLDEFDKSFPLDPRSLTLPALTARADSVADTPDGPVRTIMADMGRTTVTARTLYKVRLDVERRMQTLEATRMTMAELAALLADNTDQPVIDKTGLTGVYQFKIDLPLDATSLGLVRRREPTVFSESRAAESLGLKLERRRMPVDVVVVDKIERTPTDN